MHDLQPRKVESGAVKRWAREAWQLMQRGVILWLLYPAILAGLYALAGTASFLLPGLGVALVLLFSALAVALGTLLAAHADGRLTRTQLGRHLIRPQLLVQYARRSLSWLIRHRLGFLLGFALASFTFLLLVLLLGQPDSVTTGNARLPVFHLLGLGLLSLIFFDGIFNDAPATHIHRFLSTVLLELDWDASEVLVRTGHELNGVIMTTLHMFSSFGLVVLYSSLLAIPLGEVWRTVATLLLLPFAACFYYVSFRDIFLRVAENTPQRVPLRQTARAHAPQQG